MTATTSTAIPMDANLLSLSRIEYDFENYALNYGIPETLDPLPYRKAGSVFATGDEAESVLTSAKHDPRLRTVVCRHWLRDLCMKGAACEFLHQFDLSKMPLCRHGERCKIRDCPFRHISEENRMECAFYKSGFCIHGPFCRYKHVKRPRDDLPVVADFTLGLSQMQAGGTVVVGAGGNSKEVMASTKRPAPKPNEFYKISLCKHFAAGDCPFGASCHFAHGEAELRKYPRTNDTTTGNNNTNTTDEYNDNIFPDTVMTAMDYFVTSGSNNAIYNTTTTSETSDNTNYFLIIAATQQDLAISTIRNEWYVNQSDAEKLNAIYYDASAGSTRQVILLFTVSHSRHIQGYATLEQPATYQQSAYEVQNNNTTTSNGNEAGSDDNSNENSKNKLFTYRVGIRWCCTTEYPLRSASELAIQHDSVLTIPNALENCVGIPWKVGNALKKVLSALPTLPLYESWKHETSDDIPSVDVLLQDFRAPGGLRRESLDDGTRSAGMTVVRSPMLVDDPNLFYGNLSKVPTELSWPTMPGPGYIFGCSSDTMDECLGRGIFGLPANMKTAASFIIKPGTTIFLYNVTDRLLFGIFEAVSSVKLNIEPTAFSKNPKAISSPFPVQVRVRVGLECPPIEDTDPILNDILRTRIRGRIGPLSHAQTVAIASLLANQCGALSYMKQYRTAIKRGTGSVQAPPISLPPRMIKPKEKVTADATTTNTDSEAPPLVTSEQFVDDTNDSTTNSNPINDSNDNDNYNDDYNGDNRNVGNNANWSGLTSNIAMDDMVL